jgi:hypothetical protein
MSAGRALVLLWGIGGVLALLAQATLRLTPYAVEALTGQMVAWHWIACIGWVAFMLWSEGYRGFHKRFSPRVVSRAFHLARHPSPLHVILAPAYCMSLLHATRRARIVAWSVLIGVIGLVVLVRLAPQPWRGIVDAGVVLGLTMGAASIVLHLYWALRSGPASPPDLPERLSDAAAS